MKMEYERPYYTEIDYPPFLFYIAFGVDGDCLRVSRKRHHVDEFPESLDIACLKRPENSEYMEALIGGTLGKLLEEDSHNLYEAVQQTDKWVVIRGEVKKDSDLHYIRNAVGFIQALVDNGAIGVLDLQTFALFTPSEWTDKIFAAEFTPYSHVVILTSEMEDGSIWLHTRGMRKFGRPDISMEKVPENEMVNAASAVNQMIFYGALGAFFLQPIKLHTQSGLTCIVKPQYVEDFENADFNNSFYRVLWEECEWDLESIYSYTKIRENIWQIAEDNGVYCTLIKGKDMAIVVDTGYGNRNLRAFVESNISTPYIVVNSHGHPDHVGGNHWFDTVYALKEEWDVIRHFDEQNDSYQLKEIQVGEQISLGDIHVETVSLAGHTRGSIGLLVQEEKLLIAGDALNEELWLFNYGSLSMKELYETLQKAVEMDFYTYLCGHSNQEYQKEKIFAHIHNIENLKVDERTRCNTIGFETYCSSYEEQSGSSKIVFTKNKIEKLV